METLSLPASMVTMPCFGGADMKTLFTTSLIPEQAGPAEGGLYSIRVETAGPAPRRFAHKQV
jgi:sugar lactone lactonase YvrE